MPGAGRSSSHGLTGACDAIFRSAAPHTPQIEGLPLIHPNAAAMDISADEIVVAVPPLVTSRRCGSTQNRLTFRMDQEKGAAQ